MTEFFIQSPEDRRRAHVAIDKMDAPFRVKLSKAGQRSTSQNAYIWGVCYETILEHGLREQGWTAGDLHDYFLGEHFGWETLEAFGRRRMRPIKRSSGLSKTEFTDYIAFIQRKAADLGVYIPDPEEQ